MAPPRKAVIEADVRELMGEADEGVWQEEGLFTSMDSLVNCTKSFTHPPIDMTSPLTCPHSNSFIGVLPLSDFLPGLTKSLWRWNLTHL
jgi:hypothetical protein